ncbi:unnamed protein product [Rotaria magnacalcarata]
MADTSLNMNDQQWNMMMIPLKFTWQPTENESIYLKKLVCFRMEQRELLPFTREDLISPSVIIDDFLYHGDLKHAMNKALLEELNIRCIINACDCPLGQDILDQRHVLWINVEDATYTDIAEHFKITNEFLHSCKTKGEKVLVHCEMGVSRSSSIVLAYLMKYHHDSLEEAYDYLVKRRHCVEPNLGFLLQLIRYERQLHKTNEIAQGKNMYQKSSPIETSYTVKDSAAIISPTDELTETKTVKSKTKKKNNTLSSEVSGQAPLLQSSNSFPHPRSSWSLCHGLCCCSPSSARNAKLYSK